MAIVSNPKLTKKAHYFFRKLLVFYIVSFYTPGKWYSAAYQITGFLVRFRKGANPLQNRSSGLRHAYLLNAILSLMTRKKMPFAIPVKSKGFELFEKGRPYGMMLCSVHLPLVKVAIRYLVENGCAPQVAIAGAHHQITSVALWGSTQTIPTISTGPTVLIKMRKVLLEGATVVVLVDGAYGDSISPNTFLLANKLNADIVYFLAELLPGGTIEVSFFEATLLRGELNTQQASQQQIKELEQYAKRIVQNYNNTNLNSLCEPLPATLR